MNPGTLALVYIFKFLELAYLIVLTILLVNKSILVMGYLSEDKNKTDEETYVYYELSACSAIAVLNLFYNNLFINLRFRCKMHCGKIGFCLFDIFGRLLCDCCLMKLCRDRMISARTAIKWVVTTVVFSRTYAEVSNLTNRWESEFLIGAVARHDHNLEVYLLLYWAHHIIFILARIPIFFVYQILTCFCDRGNDFYED